MQRLESVHLVQFFLFEAQTLQLEATSAIIAPNGAGKSALLDALQIVLLGGDGRHLRFNAQAGGSHRARSIRDYCLGVYRSGEEGRKRRTATTYISLVFRDADSGIPLSCGIALGASADEPDHRQHGLYVFPGIALTLEEHLEHIGGKELPLEWARFRELGTRRCKDIGSVAELHASGERFVKDLLLRLRASPASHPEVSAYRKAFQNALNLQRVEDVDLFVRTLVAEDRPTDIARFRALLDSFRQIKERIEQVKLRIEAAENVELQYGKIAVQAQRTASYRALEAEYARDLLYAQIEQAEHQQQTATDVLASTQRALTQARLDREMAREEYTHANARLQGTQGYGEQAQLDELANRDRERLTQLKKDLLREISFVRDQFTALGKLGLASVDTRTQANALAPWNRLYDTLSTQQGDAELPWTPEQIHATARTALATSSTLITAANGHARAMHTALEQARERLAGAQQNQKRLAAGQAELNPEAIRLLGYLHDEGIAAQPVCDLVKVADPAWQPAIEAYLRSNSEALLIRIEDEERAVRLYRSLRGGRQIYGVKLALSSQARAQRPMSAEPGSVAFLLESDNNEALAFLRRQLGELRCVDTEAELVASRRGLTRDGLLAKGGSIERLRLPAASELKIGASDNRARARNLREDIEPADADVRRLLPQAERADRCQQGLARLADAEDFARLLHERALEHHNVAQRHRIAREQRQSALDSDLLRLAEHVRQLHEQAAAFEKTTEALVGDEREATNRLSDVTRLLDGLRSQEPHAAQRANSAFADPDVDPARIERSREELDEKWPTLEVRIQRCADRATDSDKQLAKLLPDAWSALAQYTKDHRIELDSDPDQWRPARSLMQRQLTQLRDTELVQYEGEAKRAYDTAVDTFRANVASALYDNFTRLRDQLTTLNRTLRNSPAFSNNERYQFHYEVLPEFRDLHRFIQRAADLGGEDGLFGSAGEVPAAFGELIENNAAARATVSPLDDYRRFFRFEVKIKQDEREIGTLSERMRSGSGGEHRAPLYVIAGAALAAAYGKSDAYPGGLGLILLDEFGDKIDAQNARAVTNYLRSLGLQLVLAAPDTAQGTLSGVLESYIELFRDGDLVQLTHIQVKPAARELLLSDAFDLHPDLLVQETARLTRELAHP